MLLFGLSRLVSSLIPCFVCVCVLQIFMRPDFILSEPATFSAVLPWSHFGVAGGKSGRDSASSRLLQEKVSGKSNSSVD